MKVLLIAAAAVLIPETAMAQDVVVPWGDWVAQWVTALQQIVLLALTTAAAYVTSAYVPPWLRAIAGKNAQARVNEVLEKAVLSAIAQTKGAVVGKRLAIPVANEVLRRSAQYAIDQAPELVNKAADTAADLIKMLLARMEQFGVAPQAGEAKVQTKAADVKPTDFDFSSAIAKGLGG